MKNLPNSSGIYYYYEGDRLLYIGRANNLSRRTTEHAGNNLWFREFKFYQKMLKMKNFGYEREKYPEDIDKILRDFEFRSRDNVMLPPHVIDLIFHRITRIEIQEMPFELAKQKEKELIQELKPPFNYETASDEYYQIRDELN